MFSSHQHFGPCNLLIRYYVRMCIMFHMKTQINRDRKVNREKNINAKDGWSNVVAVICVKSNEMVFKSVDMRSVFSPSHSSQFPVLPQSPLHCILWMPTSDWSPHIIQLGRDQTFNTFTHENQEQEYEHLGRVSGQVVLCVQSDVNINMIYIL